jgi:thiamine pyrophosphokinase
MRGIIFTGGDGPGPEKSRRLAAEADLIVAADSGLLAAEAAGLRPDWILGDMDSLDDLRRLETYPPGRVLPYLRDKDYTDTELAFSFLLDKGCGEIWIIGGGGGRTDHLFAVRALFERELCPARWITAGEDMYCLNGPGELARTIAAGGLLSVFPLGPGPWEARSGGLKWPLDGLSWNRGFFGLSNAAETGDFFIRAEAGRFLVIIPGMALKG